jgi:hypothetical protein
VISLLRATSTYRALAGVSAEFAAAVASKLAEQRQSGPFLIVGLYTRHFAAAYQITNPTEAAQLGLQVPSDLKSVLDLDLDLRRDQPWLRPVMTVLAHAREAGMPVSLLVRLAPVFGQGLLNPTLTEIRTALTAGKFYLRQSTDSDRSNIYRLFHQTLAEALVKQTVFSAQASLDATLGPCGLLGRGTGYLPTSGVVQLNDHVERLHRRPSRDGQRLRAWIRSSVGSAGWGVGEVGHVFGPFLVGDGWGD